MSTNNSEQIKPVTKSADALLLEAMSRSDVFSPQFLDFLNRRGVLPETLFEASEQRKQELAHALNHQAVWPDGSLVTEEMVSTVAMNRRPEDVFETHELEEWALDHGFIEEE